MGSNGRVIGCYGFLRALRLFVITYLSMRERFNLDEQQNILFINFAGLRIESRAQVDEMAEHVRAAYEKQGRRIYAVVNYEGTEIAPEIVDYYGERIKDLADRYGIATVRYSSSGFTRSVLRYLGAAKDLESNIFATRAEAINAIWEMERRRRAAHDETFWTSLDPRRSVLGQMLLIWAAALISLSGAAWLNLNLFIAACITLLAAAALSGLLLFIKVIKPLRRMESFAQRLIGGGSFEPLPVKGTDETGRLAHAFNETAQQLRRDIERLSGLYHISLMMSTGTEVGKINELLTRKIARLLAAEMCVILLYDEREKLLAAQLPGYGVSDDKLRLLRVELTDRSIAAHVFNASEPYLTNDAAHDPRSKMATLLNVRELLAVPLQAGERRLGTLAVMNKRGGFHEDDKQLVTIFAAQAAQLLANAQLFQQVIVAERLAAIGELVAGVAHEVRNPLCGITTTLSALERKLEDRAAIKPFLDVIKTEADRLNHIMEQLLEHSRPVRPGDELTDLRELIHEALGEFKAAAQAQQITLACVCAAAPTLRCDRRKLHGVLVNLLDNALAHTSAGGAVRVIVSASDEGARDRLQIEVRDTGAGIAPENLRKVFDPFFTTRAAGTGLGLAITRKTIHDHGGTIEVHSVRGEGASFIINLPLMKVRKQ